MITTRRSDNSTINSVSESAKGGVAVLERKQASYNEYSSNVQSEENLDQAKERMQENLAKLLNYDRYSETVKDSALQVEEQVIEVNAQEHQAFSDDDIRPTSTTMQFGDGDIENLRQDMKKQEAQNGEKYKLNAKGKAVVVLYALVLTVVLALIAINSGVLAKLSANEKMLMAEANAKMQTLSNIEMQIDSISTPEYIGEKALELGMNK